MLKFYDEAELYKLDIICSELIICKLRHYDTGSIVACIFFDTKSFNFLKKYRDDIDINIVRNYLPSNMITIENSLNIINTFCKNNFIAANNLYTPSLGMNYEVCNNIEIYNIELYNKIIENYGNVYEIAYAQDSITTITTKNKKTFAEYKLLWS